VYEHWYTALGTIEVKHGTAVVSTSLPGNADGRREAREACAAVLGSDAVAKVVVRYGSRSSEACSS
jgi:hypothetical protein